MVGVHGTVRDARRRVALCPSGRAARRQGPAPAGGDGVRIGWVRPQRLPRGGDGLVDRDQRGARRRGGARRRRRDSGRGRRARRFDARGTQSQSRALAGGGPGDHRVFPRPPSSGALTAAELGELRRLGVAGPVGVVTIITPWTAGRAVGGMQELPGGETPDGRPRAEPRTVIVTPRFPDAPLELDVAFPSPGLYVKRAGLDDDPDRSESDAKSPDRAERERARQCRRRPSGRGPRQLVPLLLLTSGSGRAATRSPSRRPAWRLPATDAPSSSGRRSRCRRPRRRWSRSKCARAVACRRRA